jgi:hypothetical protein
MLTETEFIIWCRHLNLSEQARNKVQHIRSSQPSPANVLLTFQCQMSLAECPNFVAHWEYCYERSLGCVGVLKNGLTRALRDVQWSVSNLDT